MRPICKYLLPLLSFIVMQCVHCAASDDSIVPPCVNWRDLSQTARIAQGQEIDYDISTVLFLPDGWRDTITSAGTVKLTMHYHGAIWYVIEEHARRNAKNPILCFYPGEGSNIYGRLYPTQEPFDEAITSVTVDLGRFVPGTKIASIELESFSAGYGAVRRLLAFPEVVDKTEAVVLADSLYASATTDSLGVRVPDPEQMKPFIEYASLAAAGKKKMVVAHSQIPITSYCSTKETADAIITALQLDKTELTDLPPEAAARGLDFPLVSRADRGGLHIWGYAGDNKKVHMALARALADLWRSIDTVSCQ